MVKISSHVEPLRQCKNVVLKICNAIRSNQGSGRMAIAGDVGKGEMAKKYN